MIVGRRDSWFTVEEFAEMVGREPKTVTNWASQGRIQFVRLCGVPLISLSMLENLITGAVKTGETGRVAKRILRR